MLKQAFVAAVMACAVAMTAARPEIPYSSLPAGSATLNFYTMAGSPVLGSGEILGAQYAGQGVICSVPNYNAYATNGALATFSLLQTDPNVVWIDQAGGGGGSSAVGIQVDFSVPVRRAGAWMGGSAG